MAEIVGRRKSLEKTYRGTESPGYEKDHHLFYIYSKSPRIKKKLALERITVSRSYIV